MLLRWAAQEAGAKWIDINMGCPVKKVVTKGAGAALLRNPSELGKLLEPVAKILTVPFDHQNSHGLGSRSNERR